MFCVKTNMSSLWLKVRSDFFPFTKMKLFVWNNPEHHLSNVLNTFANPLYCMVYRDPCVGLLPSLHTWAVNIITTWWFQPAWTCFNHTPQIGSFSQRGVKIGHVLEITCRAECMDHLPALKVKKRQNSIGNGWVKYSRHMKHLYLKMIHSFHIQNITCKIFSLNTKTKINRK